MHVVSYEEGFRRDGPEVVVGSSGAVCTLSELRTNETSGWFSFDDRDGSDPSLVNRFVIWRALGQNLFLEDRSFVQEVLHGSICLSFPNEVILPGTGLYEFDEFVLLLVATTSAVYRRVYSNPRWENASRRMTSMFTSSSQHDKHNAFACFGSTGEAPHTAANLLLDTGEAVFAVAYDNGNIVIISFSPVGSTLNVVQEVIRQTSRFQQLWTDLWTGADNACEAAAVSLCFYKQFGEYLLTWVGYDRKIRLWSFKQRSIQLVVDLQEALADLQGYQQSQSWVDSCKWRIKIFSTEEDSVYLVVYAHLGNMTRFCVLKSERQPRRWCLELWVNFDALGERMIDFHVTERMIYGVWTGKHSLMVKCKHLRLADAVHQDGWLDMTSMESMVIDNFKKYSLSHLVNKLFSSDVFAFEVVEKALKLCCPEANVANVAIGDMGGLRRETLRCIVARNLASEKDFVAVVSDPSPTTVSEKSGEALRRFFTTMWKNSIQYHNLSMRPLGLFVLQSCGTAGVITQERIVGLVDLKTVFGRYAVPHLTNPLKQNAETAIRYSLSLVDKLIRGGQDDFVRALLESPVDFNPSVFIRNELVAIVKADERCSAVTYVRKTILAGESSVYSYICGALESITPDRPQHRADFSHPPRLHWAGYNMLASCLRLVFEEKLAFCRALLYVLSIWMELRQHSQLPSTIWSEITSNVLPKASMHCRCYAILRWISSLTVNGRGYQGPMIMGRLLLSDCCKYAYESARYWDGILGWLSGLSADARDRFGVILPRLIYFCLTSFWPEDGCLPIFDYLHGTKEVGVLLQLGEVLHSWCPSVSGVRLYYMGCALLRLNQYDRAFDFFRQAMDDVFADEPNLVLRLQFDKFDTDTLPVRYCLKVSSLFAEHNCLPQSIRLCQGALELAADDEQRSLVCHMTFKYFVEMGEYENALQTLLKNPDRDQAEASLSDLLNIMITRKQYTSVVRFTYEHFESAFLRTLEMRARAMAPLKNKFYSLLYAYFIRQRRYTRAATCMYEKASRITLHGSWEYVKILKEKSDALLAVYSALASVDPADAFVEVMVGIDGGGELTVSRAAIRKELVFCQANVEYAALNPTTSLQEPEALVRYLVACAKYDLAEALCNLHDVPISVFVVSIVTVEIDKNDRMLQRQELHEFDDEVTFLGEVFKCDWSMMHYYLTKYRSKSASCDLYAKVAVRLMEHGFAMPTWLIYDFRNYDSYGMLRFFVEYGMNKEAVELVEYMGRRLTGVQEKQVDDEAPVWLPPLLVDNLADALEQEQTTDSADLLERLRSAVTCCLARPKPTNL